MIIGIVVWLSLVALGLRWVLHPYWWASVPILGGTRNLETARQDFPIHVASFPDSKTNAVPTANDENEVETDDPALMHWIWRETLARFVIGFVLWMSSGWFVHWFTGRIVRGPRRKFSRAQ
jgi:hypothetical protein